jgi:hypothetical protein
VGRHTRDAATAQQLPGDDSLVAAVDHSMTEGDLTSDAMDLR